MREIHLPGHRGVGLSTLLQLRITHTFMVRPPLSAFYFKSCHFEMTLFLRYKNTASDAPLCSDPVTSGSTSAAKRYMHNSACTCGSSPSVTLVVRVVRIWPDSRLEKWMHPRPPPKRMRAWLGRRQHSSLYMRIHGLRRQAAGSCPVKALNERDGTRKPMQISG